MSKVWSWLKRHWKWIVFPVGILGAVLGWFLWWRRPKDDDKFSTPDAAADAAVNGVVAAGEQRVDAVKKIEEEHAEKLATMSEQQKAEYKAVREKTPEEVAAWIDNI